MWPAGSTSFNAVAFTSYKIYAVRILSIIYIAEFNELRYKRRPIVHYADIMADQTDWMIQFDGFDPKQERLRETLCTLGNGYFATRGAAEETEADAIHYPGTYLAGGYNRQKTEIAGRIVENEDFVNLPNWLCLSFRAEDGK